MKTIKIIAPLYVELPRKTKKDKRVYLNMNTYRNLHFIVSNQAKKLYKEIIKEQIENLRFEEPIVLSLQLFKGTKRRSDKANFLAIQEKFFCDALVEFGCIDDDNDDYIYEQYYMPTILDRENPRVEITLSTKDANGKKQKFGRKLPKKE